MSEQYLWDGTGEPDPEVERLERSLAELRYQPPERRAGRRAAPTVIAGTVAAAAALVIAIAGLWTARTPARVSQWQLSMNGRTLQKIRVGQAVDTNQKESAVLDSQATGRVEIGPGSLVRLVEDRSGAETFSLEHGVIHALIWAPARTFVVETPSARTIDLGCQYTLQIASDGSGMLRVETGWVAFTSRGVESFIPAGASCHTTAHRGPGTPWFDDASPEFAAAVARLDAGDDSALSLVLNAARPRDAVSLWHLMTRLSGAERGRVFDRFSQLTPLPNEITRTAIERGDSHALDRAWEALHLGSTEWWRGWERKW